MKKRRKLILSLLLILFIAGLGFRFRDTLTQIVTNDLPIVRAHPDRLAERIQKRKEKFFLRELSRETRMLLYYYAPGLFKIKYICSIGGPHGEVTVYPGDEFSDESENQPLKITCNNGTTILTPSSQRVNFTQLMDTMSVTSSPGTPAYFSFGKGAVTTDPNTITAYFQGRAEKNEVFVLLEKDRLLMGCLKGDVQISYDEESMGMDPAKRFFFAHNCSLRLVNRLHPGETKQLIPGEVVNPQDVGKPKSAWPAHELAPLIGAAQAAVQTGTGVMSIKAQAPSATQPNMALQWSTNRTATTEPLNCTIYSQSTNETAAAVPAFTFVAQGNAGELALHGDYAKLRISMVCTNTSLSLVSNVISPK